MKSEYNIVIHSVLICNDEDTVRKEVDINFWLNEDGSVKEWWLSNQSDVDSTFTGWKDDVVNYIQSNFRPMTKLFEA